MLQHLWNSITVCIIHTFRGWLETLRVGAATNVEATELTVSDRPTLMVATFAKAGSSRQKGETSAEMGHAQAMHAWGQHELATDPHPFC